MKNFSELKKNLKKDFSNNKVIRLAILGDSATQLLTQAIRGIGYDLGFDFQIWEAEFNQIERQVSDPTSELYSFQPEIIIIFQSSHKLLQKYNKLKPEKQSLLGEIELDKIQNYSDSLATTNAKIIFFNYTEIDDSVYGNFATKTENSFLYQLRKLNYQLMEMASKKLNFYLCDISSLQNQLGKSIFFQSSIYINTEMVISIEALPYVAKKTTDLISVFNGKFKKCIILDLDNTTWGGIIGDDGIENIQIGSLGIGKAFSEFQYWVKKLKNRGIIVAVCSKNTESVAKEPFEKHPDMILRLVDIAVFVANWENKADNIRQIQSILNIGFDSMVFIDDNPFERNIVRQNIPDITVPELPEDPAEYLEYLYSLNLFETITYSNDNDERTKMYQIEAQRSTIQQKFTNEDDFLRSLEMVSVIAPFDKFNKPRVAELSQRSNQFNLRTKRYLESDLNIIAESEDFFTFTFRLEDKYGDNGLICVIILQKHDLDAIFIDTWFMSCRVLKRGMENFVLNTIVKFCSENGFKKLIGEYLPTAKNDMVKNHYHELGFESENDLWMLDVTNFNNKITYIKPN